MTNRDKVNALSNREMAVLWDYIKSNCAGNNCVFYACPDCGGDCLKGFEAWLGLECEAEENPPADNKAEKLSKKLETVFMTNGDKIKSMDNAELAKVLCQSKEFDKCNYCSYLTSDTLYCHKESCVDGIKAWLETPSEDKGDDCMNRMANVAKLLGLKLGQFFMIDGDEDICYWLDEDGLSSVNRREMLIDEGLNDTLVGLLCGYREITSIADWLGSSLVKKKVQGNE